MCFYKYDEQGNLLYEDKYAAIKHNNMKYK